MRGNPPIRFGAGERLQSPTHRYGSPRAFGVPEHVRKVTKSMSEGRVYRRKPWQAGVLSLFVPGLGQVYNGQARKGVLVFCLYGLGALAGLRNDVRTLLCAMEYRSALRGAPR